MANEFVIKNGFFSRNNSQITGSLTVAGDIKLANNYVISASSGGGHLNLRYGNDNSVILANNPDPNSFGDGLWFDNGYTGLYANDWNQYIELNSSNNITLYNTAGAIFLQPKTGSYIAVDVVGGDPSAIAYLNFDNITSTSKTFTFPDATGTVALTSDVTTLSSSMEFRITDIEVVNVGQSSSIATNTTNITKLTSVTGSYATTGSNNFNGNQQITGSLIVSSSTDQTLIIYGSGSDNPIFKIVGSQGELFSVVDSFSGSLFSANNQSGIPILEVFSDDTVHMGTIAARSLHTTTYNTINSGTTTIYTLATSSYDAVYVDYHIRSGSADSRVGNLMASYNGNSVNYTETSASQFGDTSGFTFGFAISASLMILSGSATSNNWTVKTIIRSI